MSFSRAVGAGPVVEQHWVPHTPLFQQLGVFNYVDIPGSLKTVTIPAGTATNRRPVYLQATAPPARGYAKKQVSPLHPVPGPRFSKLTFFTAPPASSFLKKTTT